MSGMTITIPELADYPVVISLPIQWGDQDAFGHVNNTAPIRWFESSRIAYLEQTQTGSIQMAPTVGPILAAVQCHYRRQLNYPDTVLIGARVTRLGRSSFTIHHVVYSEALQAPAADGESVIVVFDYERQRPVRIPQDFHQAVEQLQGGPIAS
jgi:acyl-CoA thioester hydrolase